MSGVVISKAGGAAAAGGATAAKQDEQTTALGDILIDTGDISAALSAVSVTTGGDPTGTDEGFPAAVLRDDDLSTLGPADGKWTHLRVDSIGRLWTVDGGNRSALVDSIATVPGIPPGATAFDVHYESTAAHAAGAAETVFDPPSGTLIVVTDIFVSSFGTTTGRGILFFTDDADMTYTKGTDVPIAVFSLAPSATASPGFIDHPTKPPRSDTANDQIKFQTADAIDVDIVLRGYTYTP